MRKIKLFNIVIFVFISANIFAAPSKEAGMENEGIIIAQAHPSSQLAADAGNSVKG